MVAAPFIDESWYRARVVEVKDSEVDLYYVDFGDNSWQPLSKLMVLRYGNISILHL